MRHHPASASTIILHHLAAYLVAVLSLSPAAASTETLAASASPATTATQSTTGPITWDTPRHRIHFDAPVAVALSNPDEKRWGRHQFAHISPYPGNRILLRHHAADDAVSAYGTTMPAYLSSDQGRSWQPLLPEEAPRFPNNALSSPLFNGEFLCLPMAKPLDTKLAGITLPAPAATAHSYEPWTCYRVAECPPAVQDFVRYYQAARWTPQTAAWKPQTLEYETTHGLVWLPGKPGEAHLVSRTCFERTPYRLGNELLFADYRSNFLNDDGTVPQGWGVTCMVSADNGKTWTRRGTIARDRKHQDNISEPMLAESTKGELVCVMRRADHRQKSMCISYSRDAGRTWEPYRTLDSLGDYGVFPAVVTMKCGVMLLSYGRPGINLSISCDGSGRDWSEPFTMLPGDLKAIHAHTDAYTFLLPLSDNRLLMAYTDFKYAAPDGTTRKAILVRQIRVEPKAE